MIRLICREVDNQDLAAGVAPASSITYRSFDDNLTACEQWLLSKRRNVTRECIGIEIIADGGARGEK